jgi:general secretion pathway protein G
MARSSQFTSDMHYQHTTLRSRRRRRARGVTLIEVMIVVVILGLIAGGVAVAVLPKLIIAKISTTRTSAKSLRNAAAAWRADHAPEDCPTPTRLRDEKVIDTGSKITDAWDTPFKIVCKDDETIVVSLGQDKRESDDDLFEPDVAASRP